MEREMATAFESAVEMNMPANDSSRDIEPGIAALLDRKAGDRNKPAYTARTAQEVSALLTRFLADQAPSARVVNLRRMGGGASKEQFVFDLEGGSDEGRYVLRMDPLGAIVETDRARENETLEAFAGIVPAPRAKWVDADGAVFGNPAAIMTFSGGVTKPSTMGESGNVTGLGIVFDKEWRDRLKPQFIDHLVAIHGLDWKTAHLPSFQAPDADPFQAARWQANYWSRMWRDDRVKPLPVAALVETWMLENLPETRELVFIHSDYRTGNYLFDEQSGNMTAILDWELAHIGDFHEDLGWAIQRVFGCKSEGRFFVGGLFEREEFLDLYQAASGRTVDRKALHFYELLGAYKCLVMTLASGVRVASQAHNHQDALLTWLAAAGHIFHAEICNLLEKEVGA
jgi:aminoglycoside phosphotransferase (APT) family kinase protein